MKNKSKTSRINIFFLIMLPGILFILFTQYASADSCRYCGEPYDPPRPGDESRVYALRRKHEIDCRRENGQQKTYQKTSGYSGAGYQAATQIESFDYDAFFRKRQEQGLEKQRQLNLQQEKVLDSEAEKKKKEQFQRKKQKLTSRLKGVETNNIKSSAVKGLKINEIPAPQMERTYGSHEEETDTNNKGAESESVTKKAFKASLKKTRDNVSGKAKSQIIKETAENIPGASYVKSVYDKYKKMREEMEELNLNIFQYSMKGIKGGVRRLASSDISDGGFSDEYESGREHLFGHTDIKAKTLIKEEMEGE